MCDERAAMIRKDDLARLNPQYCSRSEYWERYFIELHELCRVCTVFPTKRCRCDVGWYTGFISTEG